MYELVFCSDCNAPHLLAAERNGRLVQLNQAASDEFSLDYEPSETDEASDEDGVETFEKAIITNQSHFEATFPASIDLLGNLTTPGMETLDLHRLSPDHQLCVECGYNFRNGQFYRRALLGTPFYVGNAMPSLLEACTEGDKPNELPCRGRRLITFTDSRQGTARISAKLQQNSERDSLRSLVYRVCADNVHSLPKEEVEQRQAQLAKVENAIAKLREIGQEELTAPMTEMATQIHNELSNMGTARAAGWNELVNRLQLSQDLSRWMFDYYRNLNPELFPEMGGTRTLAELLLLREFARRPKRQNSLETLGLISVQYPALEGISQIPEAWSQLNLTLTDWRSFLKTFLDYYVRENTIIAIPSDWVGWIGGKIYPKAVIRPDSEESTTSRIVRWPRVVRGRQGRVIRLLATAAKLDLADRGDVDLVNQVMRDAWTALTRSYQLTDERTGALRSRQLLRSVEGTVMHSLSREELAFRVCTEAWKCPVTHRLLDNAFTGITPYLPNGARADNYVCEKVSIPVSRVDTTESASEAQRKAGIRRWIANNSEVHSLRAENLWTDVSDRILEGGSFFRVAEHSAQQPARKLERYEALFKAGKLNILSCSTTMEMGVDIGGISVVAMNNVPPHPSNYLQRSGRAGRRGETQAIAFSICKDNPHERSVFRNPKWPFTTTIPSPYISLNSERIVQRHVNSLLLAIFVKQVLKVQETETTSLTCEWFFYAVPEEDSPCQHLLRWLESLRVGALPTNVRRGIDQVTKGSALAGFAAAEIIGRAIAAMNRAMQSWLPAFLKLRTRAESLEGVNETDPYRRKVNFDLKSMGRDYLLSELAARAFLPGYGFPSGIVTFDHYSISDFKRGKLLTGSGRIDNQARLRERPARDLPTALREYAPGADVVLDGRRYRSEGILLNVFSPNEDFSRPQKMLVEWRCQRCGAIGHESGAVFEGRCSECGYVLQSSNIREFIQPDGFAVDFYSDPTIDVSSQAYIPVQEPWVSAASELQPLFDFRLGNYRASPEGHIFHHSSGEYGTGYAVCLRCGRAASMTVHGEYPQHLQPGRGHTRLQGKPGVEHSAECEGSDEAYAIKQSVHLGTIKQTDVFELNLKHPNERTYLKHTKNDPLSWTLAVVFRQALADILGINAEEMGYLVKPTALPDCDYPLASIVLYDKGAGGAGFATSAARHMPEIIKRSLNYLDCPDGCESACQSCLLGYDTRFHTELMDRHKAADMVRKLLPYLGLPQEAQIFGTETHSCFEPLGSELISAANRGATVIRIIAAGAYENWNIASGSFKETCLNLLNIFNAVEIVLPSESIGELGDEDREDLLALTRFGAELRLIKNPDQIDTLSCILAQIAGNSYQKTYGTNTPERNVPSFDWWDQEGCLLVASDEVEGLETSPIDPDTLRPTAHSADVELELTSECDGPLSQFGAKLWAQILKASPAVAKKLSSTVALEKVSYSDCYVCSPWSLMLLGEMVDKLRTAAGSQWNNPKFALVTSDKAASDRARGYYSEWSSRDEKIDVCMQYFSGMDIHSKVHVKPIREMPHGRSLKLIWADGSKMAVRLDHGFGCWRVDAARGDWFDIRSDVTDQVDRMYKAVSRLGVKYSKPYPTQIFLKVR